MFGVVRKIKPTWEPMPEADCLRDWLQKAVNGVYFSGIGSEDEALACVSVLLVERVLQDTVLSTPCPESEIWADINDAVVRWTSSQNVQLLRTEFREFFDFSKADSVELYAIYADVVSTCANRRLDRVNLPTSVVRLMLHLMNVRPGMHVCDPVCNYGHFMDVLRSEKGEGVDFVVAEQDAAKVAIVRTKFILGGRDPRQVRYSSGYYNEQMIHSDSFDCVVTVPPCGRRPRVPVDNSCHLNVRMPFALAERWETSYLIRSLDLVRAGGTVVFCMPEGDLCSSRGRLLQEALRNVAFVERVVSFARNSVSYSPVVNSLCVLVMRKGQVDKARKIVLSIAKGPLRDCWERNDFASFAFDEIRRSDAWTSETWSPKRSLADDEFNLRLNGGKVSRISDWFEIADYPRTNVPDRNLYYLGHGIDGVERSGGRVPDVSGRVVFHDIAAAGALMVTARSWAVSIGAIPLDCDGMVLGRSSQMYVPKGRDYRVSVVMEMVGRLPFYRRYLLNRFVGGEWREDFLDYLVPSELFRNPASTVQAYVDLQGRKRILRDRLRKISNDVTNKYREWLGIRQSGGLGAMYWSEKFPTERLGALAQGGRSCKGESKDEILRNLKVMAPGLDSNYLAGYLVCDFHPPAIRDVARLRSSRTDYGSNISTIGIPLPPSAQQDMIARGVENELLAFRSTIRELAYVQNHEERALLEDVERRCFG